MLIIVNCYLVKDVYRVHLLGRCEEAGRWYLEMQGVQEDHRWWCLDSVDNGCRYRSQVSCSIGFSGST